MELINWDWLGIHYAAQRKPLSKNIQLCNILPRNYLSYAFEFQLVPFAFSLTLGGPFMVKGEGDFFKKNPFYVGTNIMGKIYRGIVLHRGLMIKLRGKEFHKIYFPLIWTL